MDTPVLYPMQLSPVCKSTIWGGNRMRDCFGFQTKLDNIAEAWMLSARADNPGFILGGEYLGERIDRLLEQYPSLIASGNENPACPLLIKFIDARDRLSIQVHPDDAYAKAAGCADPRGKTEMWIVLEASMGAELIFGTEHDFTEDELRRAIEGGTLETLLHYVPVKAGDVFFIPAGLIHAIGGGILLAEVQQNCDTTYRVYDYNRRQADGSLRQLHIDDAVKCAKHFTPEQIDALRYEKGDRNALADSAYFHVESVSVRGEREFSVDTGSFVSLLVTSGEGTLVYEGQEYPLPTGASYFLPAGMGSYTVRTAGRSVGLLLSRLP